MDDHTLDPRAGGHTPDRGDYGDRPAATLVGGDQGADHRGVVYGRSIGVGGGAPTRASTPAAVWLAPLCPERTIGGQQRGPAGICSDDNRWRNGAGIVRRQAGSAIEIEVAGLIVRVRGRVMAEALVEVLAAVKRAR